MNKLKIQAVQIPALLNLEFYTTQKRHLFVFTLFTTQKMTPEEEDAFYNELVSNFEIDECKEAEPNIVGKNNYI